MHGSGARRRRSISGTMEKVPQPKPREATQLVKPEPIDLKEAVKARRYAIEIARSNGNDNAA